MITLKSEAELSLMREAGSIVAGALDLMEKTIAVGVTTKKLDTIAEQYIRSRGAIPSFKNYGGFPASLCISVNNTVVHGFPGSYALQEGDIVSIDAGAYFKGFHGDAARTFPVGTISPEAQQLLAVTKQSFFEGIRFAKEGCRLGDISSAVQNFVENNGFSVVRDFTGHGIGRALHEDPAVPNYGLAGRGIRLRSGMCLAIEPMVNSGTWQVRILPDGWTTVTRDGSLSAHYENTVAITKTGPKILTEL